MSNSAIATLKSAIEQRGLPTEIGATGWISETQEFYYDDNHVATITDSLKGWISVDRDDNGEGEPSYSDIETVVKIINSMINSNVSDTSLVITDDAGEEIHIALTNEEANGKGSDCDYAIPEDEFNALAISVLEEAGEEVDEDDIDAHEFLWEHCDDRGGETEYNFGYSVSHVTFDDGTILSFGADSEGNLKIITE